MGGWREGKARTGGIRLVRGAQHLLRARHVSLPLPRDPEADQRVHVLRRLRLRVLEEAQHCVTAAVQ